MSAQKTGQPQPVIHKFTQTDMPIKAPVKTYNFSDLTRYFKYNMSSGVMMATIERMVSDARQDLEGNNFAVAVKFIAIGIMIFMVMLGAVILLRTLPADGGGTAPTFLAALPLLVWRRLRK